MEAERRTLQRFARIAVVLAMGLAIADVSRAAPSLKPIPAAAVSAKSETSSKPPANSAEEVDEVVAPDSPRASVEAYLQLCEHGHFQDAAHYLSLSESQTKRAAELARKLKTVLDSHFRIDLETLAPNSEGDNNDHLPANYEQIGQIADPNGKTSSPVRLVRRGYPGPNARWVFSRSTVNRIDDWYDHLEQRWFLDNLPKPLLKMGPRDLMIWQWIALPLLAAASWAIGNLLSRASRRVLAIFAKRTTGLWDDALVERLGGPLTLAWMLLLVYWAFPWLGFFVLAEDFVKGLLRGGFWFTFFWVVSRLIDAWGKVITASDWAKDHSASTALIPLSVRVGKIAVFVVAIIALVSAMGYPAASLLAGLGVGGLALALAAQKTVENLFGAFSIGADQPFREGDFIRVDDFTGTVESLGLRSTRIRTSDRTLISIPNGKLSEMRVESYAARDRLRLYCTIGLVYSTTADKMRQVLAELEGVLRNHPKIWPENIVVRFKELSASALNIEVEAWFRTANFSEFQDIRQEVLLSFMDCVKRAGSDFAFPTQTVHLHGG